MSLEFIVIIILPPSVSSSLNDFINNGVPGVKRLSETSVMIYHREEDELLGRVITLTNLSAFFVNLLTEFYPEPWCFIDENK